MINPNSKKSTRHPQNIEGGRSKRLISKYIQLSKRPVRDDQLYLQPQVNHENDP